MCNRPNKPVYDITFALRFLRGKQMVAREQTRVAYAPWWLTILGTQVYAEFDVIRFFIALKYCLSTVVWVLQSIGAGYQYEYIYNQYEEQKHQYRPKKALSIELYL